MSNNCISVPNKVNNQAPLLENKKFDYNLEALRGFAALFVALGHAILFNNVLDPQFYSRALAMAPIPGHLCVLIFFVLSGYVIGISNKQSLEGRAVFAYLKKRFIRLYPIYIVALIFAVLVAPNRDSIFIVINNLSFTQGIFAPTISANGAVWSLQYEVLYYLIFIPISFLRFNVIVIAFLTIALGLGNYFLYPEINFPLLSSYSFGFTFWMVGLIIAKYFKNSKPETNYRLLLSYIFLILCIGDFNIFTDIIFKFSVIVGNKLEFPTTVEWFDRAIPFIELSYLPYFSLFILVFSGKEFKYKKGIILFMQLLPSITFIYLAKNASTESISNYLMPSFFYILSLIIFFFKNKILNSLSEKIIKAGSWIGSISYGIYIINMPMIYLFNKIDLFSGTIVTFSFRVLLFIALVIFSSFILEKKFQPWIRQKVG